MKPQITRCTQILIAMVMALSSIALKAVPPPSELIKNPFNKMSAHHRPIGAGAEAGVPGGCHYEDVGSDSAAYDQPGPVNSRGRIANVGQFVLGRTNQGRKWTYEVKPGDPMVEITVRGKEKTSIRMPAGARYPKSAKGPLDGDFNALFYPRNGLQIDMLDLFTDFHYHERIAVTWKSYPIAGDDRTEGKHGTDTKNRDSTGASLMRWPCGVLRGFDINSPDPKPIQHALQCTATRKGPPGAQILNKKVVWPASGMDASGKKSKVQNLGDIPYGTRLFIRAEDYPVLKEKLKGNKRGLVLLDTMRYYGCYIFDGQGQVAKGDKGVLQIRCDGEVGLTPEGKEIPGVIEDADKALAVMLPYIYPMRNPRSHLKESEIWTDGLPYAGGGGPIDPTKSVNNAWDVK